METRVLTLPTETKPTLGGTVILPVVPGHTVVKQGDSGWYTAHNAVVPSPKGAPNDWSRPTVYSLYQCGSAFCVFGEKADLDKLGAGPTLQDYTGAWTKYNVTGTTLDPISNKVVAVQRVIDIKTAVPADVSPTKPLIKDGITITALKKSITSSNGEATLAVAEAITIKPIGDIKVLK